MNREMQRKFNEVVKDENGVKVNNIYFTPEIKFKYDEDTESYYIYHNNHIIGVINYKDIEKFI